MQPVCPRLQSPIPSLGYLRNARICRPVGARSAPSSSSRSCPEPKSDPKRLTARSDSHARVEVRSVEDLDAMTFRELKNLFPVVFGRSTNSNNKEWIHKTLKEHFTSALYSSGPGVRPTETAAMAREATNTPWPCAAPDPAPLSNITNLADDNPDKGGTDVNGGGSGGVIRGRGSVSSRAGMNITAAAGVGTGVDIGIGIKPTAADANNPWYVISSRIPLYSTLRRYQSSTCEKNSFHGFVYFNRSAVSDR